MDGMIIPKPPRFDARFFMLGAASMVLWFRLSKLSAEVARVNPSARVECCSYGRVPLHSVLDVEAPRTDIQGVSHEVGTPAVMRWCLGVDVSSFTHTGR